MDFVHPSVLAYDLAPVRGSDLNLMKGSDRTRSRSLCLFGGTRLGSGRLRSLC
jgi:hypothetical protein